jgi:thiosulfate/3-mercaptopyruvate sulfurtransferase
MSKATITSSLVSVQWLAENLGAENLVILDASMKPVTPLRSFDPQEETSFIQGARQFDFDQHLCDHNTTLPHMMPSPEFFTEEMQKLGINQDSAIVVYDYVGVYSSPRAWWMFRAMGHGQVAVLDGGLPAWKKEKFPCSSQVELSAEKRGDFESQPLSGLFVNSAHVLEATADPRYAILDARSEGRFHGVEPEPRAGLRSGHIPNSLNLPFAQVVVDGLVLPPTELDSVFSKLVDKEQNLIFTCGSGVTACITALAGELAGYSKIAVYDGSWSEWGSESSQLPVAKN